MEERKRKKWPIVGLAAIVAVLTVLGEARVIPPVVPQLVGVLVGAVVPPVEVQEVKPSGS